MKDEVRSLAAIYIKKLHFYWRLVDSESKNSIIPKFLPFETGYDAQLGLLIQKRNKKVLDALHLVYQEEWNIGNIQDINNLSIGYVKDFLSFIKSYVPFSEQKNKKILEIGSGGCIILEHLKHEGFDVLGVDPSPYSEKEGKKRGVTVMTDFFPSKKIKETFDVIYHSDVLEHVEDPIAFLQIQHSYLNDNGLIIISTPDCSAAIRKGDISMFLHQHLSYFDRESLKQVVMAAGFRNIIIRKAKYGGSLYCIAKKGKKASDNKLIKKRFSEKKYHTFIAKHIQIKERLKKYVEKILKENQTLGIYAPVRALPYLPDLHLYNKIRLFDDTSYWHNKYFDGIPTKVENFEDLKKNPIGNIIIMSPTFGQVIEKKIKKDFGNKINIKKLTDFF